MLYTLATSLNECQSACISNLGCLAVDIDRNVSPVQCYLHTNLNAQTFAATGVDHYTLTQRCINIESNSSSTGEHLIFMQMIIKVPPFVLSRLLSSVWVSRIGSASDWCALQEALYKSIDIMQYNYFQSRRFIEHPLKLNDCRERKNTDKTS